MKRNFLWIGLLGILALIAVGGCSHPGELRVQLGEQIKVPQDRAIVFLVDGLRADMLEEMLCQGELPNIQRYLYDCGVWVENGVTGIPSITYSVISSMVTGRFAGHHGIMGNKWFDRVSGQYQSYAYVRSYARVDQDLRAPTIYELLNDRYTISIQTVHRRGADRPIDNWMSSGVNWFFRRYMNVDRNVAQRFEVINNIARKTGRWPDFIMAYFPATDEIGHRFGSDSPEYRRSILNLDEQIGRICRALDENGILDSYYLVLISDHGHAQTGEDNYWEPQVTFRRDLNIPVVDDWFLEKQSSLEWHEHLRRYRVVLVNGGARRIHLHLRTGDHWIPEPSFEEVERFFELQYPNALARTGGKDLIDWLIAQPSVDIVTAKVDRNNIRVYSTQGQGLVTRKIDPEGVKVYRYQPIENDPLGYINHPVMREMLGDQFFDSRTWLDATCDIQYPDFIPQIVEMYDNHRAGQVVFFARKGWDFNKADLGGHGSVVREDMIVPFILAGPGIEHGRIRTARIVDLMPTVLEMLGVEDRLRTIGPIDGESLMPLISRKHALKED